MYKFYPFLEGSVTKRSIGSTQINSQKATQEGRGRTGQGSRREANALSSVQYPDLLRDGIAKLTGGILAFTVVGDRLTALRKIPLVSIYIRVSTAKQLAGHGPVEQLHTVIDSMDRKHGKLEDNKWGILHLFLEAASGRAKAVAKRKQWLAALDLYQAAKPLKLRHSIVVARMDRVARDASVFADIVAKGIKMTFADFPDAETHTPTGRMVFGILAMAAQHDCDLGQLRTQAGLTAARASLAASGMTPSITQAMAETTMVVRDGAQAYKQLMLEAAMPLIAQGCTLQYMCNFLTREGWTTFQAPGPGTRKWPLVAGKPRTPFWALPHDWAQIGPVSETSHFSQFPTLEFPKMAENGRKVKHIVVLRFKERSLFCEFPKMAENGRKSPFFEISENRP